MMTGGADESTVRESMKLGADDFLEKPFTMQEMLEAIKARLHRYQQLRDAVEAKMNQLRQNMSTSLPHEFLTPLTGVLGFADLMRTSYDTLQPADIYEMATLIHQSGNRLLRLINQYLFYSELNLLKTDIQREKTFCQGHTDGLKALVETAALTCAQNVSRVEDLYLDLVDGTIEFKEDLFRKVVEELIENAFKFSTAGKPVRIKSFYRDKYFWLNIKDCGRGMSEEQIAQIGAYQQFNRQQYEQQGLGLGLAIVKRLLDLGNSKLMIRSEMSCGTVVDIMVPGAPVSDESVSQ
jgi:signal transduction histidine kinase